MEYCYLIGVYIENIPSIRVVDTWEIEGYVRDPDKEEFIVQKDSDKGWITVAESQIVEEAIEIALTLKLALKFKNLIIERDELIHKGGYDARCHKIDDELIPDIIKQVIPGMMNKFNNYINQ